MSETFRIIRAFPRYSVSETGTVRRDADGLAMAHSKPRNKREYPCVHLRRAGERKRIAVHILVANEWLGTKPFPNAEVRHLDGNHLNPSASNLAWGSRKDNAADRDAHGTTARGLRHGIHSRNVAGTNNPNAKLDAAAVAKIVQLSRQGHSQRMIAERTGTSQKVVWKILNGKAYVEEAALALCAASLRAIAKERG